MAPSLPSSSQTRALRRLGPCSEQSRGEACSDVSLEPGDGDPDCQEHHHEGVRPRRNEFEAPEALVWPGPHFRAQGQRQRLLRGRALELRVGAGRPPRLRLFSVLPQLLGLLVQGLVLLLVRVQELVVVLLVLVLGLGAVYLVPLVS